MNHLIDFFPRLINMSAIASIVILFVLAVRLILKRTPKIFSYALWAIVLIRLLVPIHIPSPISAIPVTQTTNSAEINAALPDFDFETLSDRQENKISLQHEIETGNPISVRVGHSLEPVAYLTLAWLAGMGIMVLYSGLSYWKIRKKVRISVPLRDNIFIADDIGSPCVIGFGMPNIYLPNGLSEKEQEYIILHEQHHIKRLDHIIKGIAFIALMIHWFNPLVWVAFILACKDMEMSCDEAVIRKLGSDVRADYSASLLTLATGHRIIAGTPLAFGEGDTKGRIKNLAKWKKPAIWVLVTALILCAMLAVCLLTNPIEATGEQGGVTYYTGTVVESVKTPFNQEGEEQRPYIVLQCEDGERRQFWMDGYDRISADLLDRYVIVRGKIESGTGLLVATNISISEKEFSDSLEEAINRCILDHNYSPRYEGMLQVASFVQLSSENEGIASVDSDMKLIEKATVYGLAFHQVFRLEDGILVEEGGSHIPVVLTFTYDASEGFTLTEYWEPRDGSYYAKDLKAKFNGRPWPDTQKYLQQQMMDNYLQAMEYYEVGTDVLINTLLDSVRAKAQFTLLENLIESEDADVQSLLHYSNETLQYCCSEFLKGTQTDARADVMAAICKKIISDWGEPLLLIDSDPPLTAQEWFDLYLEHALKLFEELEQDELIEKYPASCVLLKLTGHMNILPNWGITLRAENATPNGATIILSQEGGYLPNRLFYGSGYHLEKYENNQWVALEPLTELVWTTLAYSIPLDDSVTLNINWENTYGTLEKGRYRLGKGVSEQSAPGNVEYAEFFAEFEIS